MDGFDFLPFAGAVGTVIIGNQFQRLGGVGDFVVRIVVGGRERRWCVVGMIEAGLVVGGHLHFTPRASGGGILDVVRIMIGRIHGHVSHVVEHIVSIKPFCRVLVHVVETNI